MNPEQTIGRPLLMRQLLNLGYTLRQMENCREDDPLVTVDEGPSGVIDRLEYLLRTLDRLELRNSRDSARVNLGRWRLVPRRRYDNGENTLGSQAGLLQGILCDLSLKIKAEASSMYLYPASPISEFDIERFIDEPSNMFGLPVSLDPQLPPQVDFLLEEAGRCFAVGFGPSALLFTLLATEAIVKYYYEQIAGRPPHRMTWGTINRRLKKSMRALLRFWMFWAEL